MSVFLEGNLHRYLGLSTDVKPLIANDGRVIPVGSSFLETDSGWLFRFNGTLWALAQPHAGADVGAALVDVNASLMQVLRELRIMRQIWEIYTELSGENLEAGDLVPA